MLGPNGRLQTRRISISKGRRPKTTAPMRGAGDKKPKTDVDLTESHLDSPMKISFQYVDRDSAQSWVWPTGAAIADVVNFLVDISSTNWSELLNQSTGSLRRRRKHHPMPFDGVCKDARDRVLKLHLDEKFDEFFRFRADGEGRLWGFEQSGTFYPLWWDPEHQVVPSERK